MSTETSASAFELSRFCRAVEDRDAATQVGMYADDVVVTIADRIHQPGAPQILRGRNEVAGWIGDICSREMSHTVHHAVADGHGAAFSEACRYPDGTNVLCATVLELDDGHIIHQTVVQAWDEP
jgi:ketosteroid isomerase-like protein